MMPAVIPFALHVFHLATAHHLNHARSPFLFALFPVHGHCIQEAL